MTIIKVKPFSMKPDGKFKFFGDEVGTPDWYMILDTLYKYLGRQNIVVGWDDTEPFINIKCIEDEGCYVYEFDHEYILQIIESICEPFEPFNFVYLKNDHLVFEIIYD